MPDPSGPPLIAASGITRSFGAVRALRGVDLEIRAGQVHGLIGANGAGKSTFLNILGGAVTPSAGSIAVDGVETTIKDTRASSALGFSFIWQELALVPEFPAWTNMTLGMRATTLLGLGDKRRRRAAARAVADRLELSFDLDIPVRQLSIADRGMVAIGRALVEDARFVAMDEPTAALSDVECERLFRVIEHLRADGVAIAYVSHRLDEIERLCDIVTVFKDGQTVAEHRRGEYTREDLILGITGAPSLAAASESQPLTVAGDAPTVLRVEGLNYAPRVIDVSFELRQGEILGLAGVVGAGRTETAKLVFGVTKPDAGSMTLDGKPFSPRGTAAAIRRGVGMVPEERRSEALVLTDTVGENIMLGGWKRYRVARWLPIVSARRAKRAAVELTGQLRIKTDGVDARVRTLSGGNQQKVVFARWIERGVRILLLDEPTRGVDIGARHQIWQQVEEFVARGGSVVVISSELQELAICHRIVVLVEGRDVATLQGPGVTEPQMLESIYGWTKKLADQK